jgi:hypothetical protein
MEGNQMKAGNTIRIALGVALLAVAIAAIPAGAGASSGASSKSSCSLSYDESTHLGTSYVTSLKVRNTSCGKGEKVVKDFHKCRKANGGADGHCKSKVDGYKCKEGDRESTPAQYNAKVVCKNGEKKIVHTYTQQT